MEFYAQQSALLDELDLMQGAVERKSTIPILSHFLVETVGSGLQISASDLEVGARSSCRVELKSEGKAAVPARRLLGDHSVAAGRRNPFQAAGKPLAARHMPAVLVQAGEHGY